VTQRLLQLDRGVVRVALYPPDDRCLGYYLVLLQGGLQDKGGRPGRDGTLKALPVSQIPVPNSGGLAVTGRQLWRRRQHLERLAWLEFNLLQAIGAGQPGVLRGLPNQAGA
jgi:hypothetical protein